MALPKVVTEKRAPPSTVSQPSSSPFLPQPSVTDHHLSAAIDTDLSVCSGLPPTLFS